MAHTFGSLLEEGKVAFQSLKDRQDAFDASLDRMKKMVAEHKELMTSHPQVAEDGTILLDNMLLIQQKTIELQEMVRTVDKETSELIQSAKKSSDRAKKLIAIAQEKGWMA